MDEKIKKKAAQKDTFGKILKYIRKYWFFIILSLVFAAVTVALTLYIPILTGRAIDYIIGPGNVEFGAVWKILQTIVIHEQRNQRNCNRDRDRSDSGCPVDHEYM